MDLFTLLPLAIAIFVFWKLRSVLGTRGGAQPPARPPVGSGESGVETNDNVVTLPGATRSEEPPSSEVSLARVRAYAGEDDELRDGLEEIVERDPEFDPESFLAGARMAYEMIVTAFADADRATLKNLLSREVYDSFSQVIDARAEAGEEVRTSFVGIEKSTIVGAGVADGEAQVTASFVSQIISATVDRGGDVIEGDLQEVAEVTDVWTFARPVRSRDPNWKLVATDA